MKAVCMTIFALTAFSLLVFAGDNSESQPVASGTPLILFSLAIAAPLGPDFLARSGESMCTI